MFLRQGKERMKEEVNIGRVAKGKLISKVKDPIRQDVSGSGRTYLTV